MTIYLLLGHFNYEGDEVIAGFSSEAKRAAYVNNADIDPQHPFGYDFLIDKEIELDPEGAI
jgi:hypothetical protein